MPQISTLINNTLELLEGLLEDHRSTTLIICCSREDFLSQLLDQFQQRSPNSAELPVKHSFLQPTLGLLAVSTSIKLVYCASLPVLRAQLSRYSTQPALGSSHRLVILDLVALHHGTSEFTLQGLSRTLSTAVSVAHQRQSELTLVECKDINDPTDPNRGPSLWDAHVPLLSGSIKIGQEGSRWAGREIVIRRIAAKWFDFSLDETSVIGKSAPVGAAMVDKEMLI